MDRSYHLRDSKLDRSFLNQTYHGSDKSLDYQTALGEPSEETEPLREPDEALRVSRRGGKSKKHRKSLRLCPAQPASAAIEPNLSS